MRYTHSSSLWDYGCVTSLIFFSTCSTVGHSVWESFSLQVLKLYCCEAFGHNCLQRCLVHSSTPLALTASIENNILNSWGVPASIYLIYAKIIFIQCAAVVWFAEHETLWILLMIHTQDRNWQELFCQQSKIFCFMSLYLRHTCSDDLRLPHRGLESLPSWWHEPVQVVSTPG